MKTSTKVESKPSLDAVLVGLYIAFFFLEISDRIAMLEKIRFHFLFGGLVGGVCLTTYLNEEFNKAKACKAVVTFTWVLIFIFSFYSIFSFTPDESQRILIDRVFKFAIVAFFIMVASRSVKDLRLVVVLMLLSWLKISSEGFLGWVDGSMVWENQGIQRLHGSSSNYEHPNSFSGFAVGCLAFCFYMFPVFRQKGIKLLIATIAIFALVIIVFAGSRTGYLATILLAVVIALRAKLPVSKILLAMFLSAVILMITVPQQYTERFESIFTGEEKEGNSSDTRVQIILDAYEIFKEYPLGIGVGAFPAVRMEMFERFQDTHNLYLEVLTNIGFIGLLVFLAFVYQMLKVLRINVERLENCEVKGDDELFIIALCNATYAYICARLVLGAFGMDMYEIYWWLALGFCLGSARLIEERENKVIGSHK